MNDDEIFLKSQQQLFIDICNVYPSCDILKLTSFFYLLLKQFNADNELQQFEIFFLRQNAFKLNTFEDITKCIRDAENDIQNKYINILSFFENLITELDKYLLSQKDNKTENIDKILNDYKKYVDSKLKELKRPENKTEEQQQMMFGCNTDKKISLSPTQGIAMLNENPYDFFISKVLNLSTIDDWEMLISSRLYGLIIHDAMQSFTTFCNSCNDIYAVDLKEKFINIAITKFNNLDIKIGDFISSKLNQIAEMAEKLEHNARNKNCKVLCEKNISHTINDINIKAKADRIEIDEYNKKIYIYDYKTGSLPETKDELEGKKTQVSIIAILLMQKPEYRDFSIGGLYYVPLSGKITDKIVEIDKNIIKNIQENLILLVEEYFYNGKVKENIIFPFIKNTNTDITLLSRKYEFVF